MEGVNHVHVRQIRRSRLIGQVHRVLQRQVPDGERLELGVAGPDAPLVVVVELGQAGSHLAAAGSRGGHHHQRAGGLSVFIFPKPLVADDKIHVVGISWDRIMLVAADPQRCQALEEGVSGGLAVVLGDHHPAHIEPHTLENVDQAQDILVVGDSQIPPDLVFLNIAGIDNQQNLHIVP